jgi:hypothetical protein
MTGTVDARNVEFRDKIKFWILDASCWLFIQRLKVHLHFLCVCGVNRHCDVVFGSPQVNVDKEIAVFQSHRVVKKKKKVIRQLLKCEACMKCEMYV